MILINLLLNLEEVKLSFLLNFVIQIPEKSFLACLSTII